MSIKFTLPAVMCFLQFKTKSNYLYIADKYFFGKDINKTHVKLNNH